MEVSERERHCKVLLTPANISAVRHNPAPYILPVIPRLLPSDVVEGEHFIVADLRRLASGGASFSRGPAVEASSEVRGVGGTSGSSSSSESSSLGHPSPDRGTRSESPDKLRLPVQVARPAPRVVRISRKGGAGRRDVSGSRGEDFIPWVPSHSEDSRDLEEEEREERMTGLLHRYAARKRKRQVISDSESGPAPVRDMDPHQPDALAKAPETCQVPAGRQPSVEGSSGGQVIHIPGSPESGSTGQNELIGNSQTGSGEADPAPSAL